MANQTEPALGWWTYQALRLRCAARGAGSVASNISEYIGAAFVAALGIWRLKVTVAFTGDPAVDAGLTGLALTWILVVLWRFVFGAPYQMQSDLQACLSTLGVKVGRLKSQMSPEIARQSPRYLVLRDQLNPETGLLAPVSRMETGMAKLSELAEDVRGGSGGAYYIAADVGQWLLTDARRHYGSSQKYFEIQAAVGNAMAAIHDAFAKHLK